MEKFFLKSILWKLAGKRGKGRMFSMGNEEAEALSGEELKAWLKKYKKSRKWLADKTGTTKSAVDKWCLAESLPQKSGISVRNAFESYVASADPFEDYDFVVVPLPKKIMSRVNAVADMNERSVREWIRDIIMENCDIVPDFGEETRGYDQAGDKD